MPWKPNRLINLNKKHVRNTELASHLFSLVADYKRFSQLIREPVSQRSNLAKLKKTYTQISNTKCWIPNATQNYLESLKHRIKSTSRNEQDVTASHKVLSLFYCPILHIHFTATHVNTSAAHMAQTEQNIFLFNIQTNFLMSSQRVAKF